MSQSLLFCWGTEHVKKSLRSMLIAMDQVDFKRAALITDTSKTDMSDFETIIDKYDISVYDMKAELNDNLQNDDENRYGFNQLFVQETAKHITDDFCLNVQHDSTIINAEYWNSEFLDYDYVAAPWPMGIIQASDMVAGRIEKIPNVVGNGGFSLENTQVCRRIQQARVVSQKRRPQHLCFQLRPHDK